MAYIILVYIICYHNIMDGLRYFYASYTPVYNLVFEWLPVKQRVYVKLYFI